MVDTGEIAEDVSGTDESLSTGLAPDLAGGSALDLVIDLTFGGTGLEITARDGFRV